MQWLKDILYTVQMLNILAEESFHSYLRNSKSQITKWIFQFSGFMMCKLQETVKIRLISEICVPFFRNISTLIWLIYTDAKRLESFEGSSLI